MSVKLDTNDALHAARLSVAMAHQRSDLNCFVTVVDTPIAPQVGPLCGVPCAVKDMIDTAGVRTTYGSRHFADHVPERNADCVDVLVRAGVVVVGKTTTHEFANGPVGDSSINGAAHNPFDPERITGGSSGGSAAAVAAGIVPLALGTDTGGSSRIPASLCGVNGFKPTAGIVPMNGVFPLARSLDTVGFLTRELDLLQQVWSFFETSSTSLAGARVGLLNTDPLHPVAPEVRELVHRYVEGMDVQTITMPRISETKQIYRRIHGSESHALHRDRLLTAPELFQKDVRERLRAAENVRGWEYVDAIESRRQLQDQLAVIFERVGILALPTTPIPAPQLGRRVITIRSAEHSIRDALLSLTLPWSVLGWPAISVPAGAVDGLPVGIQFVAAPGCDSALLDFAIRTSRSAVRNQHPRDGENDHD